MKKILSCIAICLFSLTIKANISVNFNEEIGKIRAMNGVNNGPMAKTASQTRHNFEEFKAARIPFARLHDASFSEAYGGCHVVDITSIFTDFSKDANKAENYDFTLTDVYLKTIQSAGTEIFFRLGQKIEHPIKKYGIYPPKDFKKWAVICEHIIRHYNEGWADGLHMGIRYWEIWNEPDLDLKQWQTNPRTWGGSEEAFYDLYETAAKHLKQKFPDLKIGGPAIAGNMEWSDRFLAKMQERKVPMDFVSWHIYTTKPSKMSEREKIVRGMMNKYGYGQAESILNEWNYVRGWSDEFIYSVKIMEKDKGAAFNAAVMSAMQDAGTDILMYYDARPETPFNGLFDFTTMLPTKAYYPFFIWSDLVELGTQCKAETDDPELFITAAHDKAGKWSIMLTRYNDDDNKTMPKKLSINVAGVQDGRVDGYLTDCHYMHTKTYYKVENGKINLMLQPNSVLQLVGEK